MSNCNQKHHENHDHIHSQSCGHTAVLHNGHIDYLHDGHLHHMHEGHVDEHCIEITDENPDQCTIGQSINHEGCHIHGPGCGHEAIPHGDHICYLVDGRLHHPHDGHCDDHGPIMIIS